MNEVPYQPLPPDVDEVRYAFGPDSMTHDDGPVGRTIEIAGIASRQYPGTDRTAWVHVPAACTMAVPNG